MVFRKIRIYSDMVMLQHTLFAMPFALSALFMAAGGFPGWHKLLWAAAAMAGARNGANALNRLIDADIDAQNTRTSGRHIPAGIVKKGEALLLVVFFFLLFILSAFMLNPLCAALLPIPAVIFILYSYTKRYTWMCHMVLGIAIGGAPVGAWLAVTGRLDISLIPAFVMGTGAALWVAGFDIIYALEDVEFDRSHRLYSIPASFGIKGALDFSAVFHFTSVVLFCALPIFTSLGAIYYIGISIISGLLYYEHRIVSPANLKLLETASYTINEIVGLVFLVFSCADIFVR